MVFLVPNTPLTQTLCALAGETLEIKYLVNKKKTSTYILIYEIGN